MDEMAEFKCPRCGGIRQRDLLDGLCGACLARGLFAPEPVALDLPEGPGAGLQVSTSASVELRNEGTDGGGLLRLGDYEILERIGRGGMGMVYRARQVSLNRIVALKTVGSGILAEDRAVQRFYFEAQAAAALRHPNIVAIHDVGQVDGLHFYAMEFIHGPNLAQAMQARAFAPREAAELLKHVARAIAFAHEQGIIHRDLKPSNILLDQRGEVHVADFGLAKILADVSGHTMTGEVLGSASYMSPEQAQGASREVGTRSDVYALGAILYELLCGQPPFQASQPIETLRQVIECEPKAPRSIIPSVPLDLQTICLKCLEKAPGKRYANGRELAEELERFLRREPIQARPVSLMERWLRWCWRNPALAGMGLTFLVGFMGVVWGWRRAVVGEWNARKNEYAAKMILAQHEYERSNIGAALDLLETLRDPKAGSDLGGFEWAYLHRLCHQEQRVIPLGDCLIRAVAFSPDGSRLAVIIDLDRKSGRLLILDTATGKQIGQSEPGYFDVNTGIAFAPDGKILATSGPDGTILVRGMPNGAVCHVLKGHTGSVACLAFSPDGQSLVSGSQDQTVRLWDFKNGVTRRIFRSNCNRGVFCLAWSPDGRFLATGADDNCARIYDITAGAEIHQLRGHNSYVFAIGYSPDGRFLATGGGDSRVLIWESATGRRIQQLEGHTSFIYGLAFADLSTLISASWDHTIRVWDTASGMTRRVLRGHRSFVDCLALSPDRKTVASGGHDGTVRFWDPAQPEDIQLRGHRQAVGRLHFSPDGQRLVTSSEDEIIRLWDTSRGGQMAEWPSRGAAFMPNSNHLLVGGLDGRLLVANGESGKTIGQFPAHTAPITEVAVSREGKRIITTATNGEMKVWSTWGEAPLLTARVHQRDDFRAYFTPDGKRILATDTSGRVHVWDASTVRETAQFQRRPYKAGTLCISPDSELIATCEDGESMVWELENGSIRFRFPSIDSPMFACFSPDSRTLLSGSEDGTCHVRDARNGRIRFSLRGHSNRVLAVLFSPDGRRMATAGDDRTIRVWDAATGLELLSIRAHDREIPWLAFSADGLRLASCSYDLTAKIFTAASENQIAAWQPEKRIELRH